MSLEEIETSLREMRCVVIEDGGQFVLVYPHGYGASKRSHELLAKRREAALVESYLWLYPDLLYAAGLETILHIISKDFRVTIPDLMGRSRSEPLATARRVAMALTRKLTRATLPEIGTAFARDHGTVIYAVESIQTQCEIDPRFGARVGALTEKCRAALTPETAAELKD